MKSRLTLPFTFSEKGFTLLEVIVAIGVFGVITVVVASVLVNTLRGANKTNIVTAVRQNGDTLLTQMSRQLRTATKLTFPTTPCDPANPSYNHVSFTTVDNVDVTYQCNATTINDASGNSLLDTGIVRIAPGSGMCNFYCVQDLPSESPIIKIDFTLSNAGGTLAEQSSQIEFQTSVVMRNILR